MSAPRATILFDGTCVLCSRLYRFVTMRDAQRRFRFVALQSDEGRALAQRHGIDPDDPDTFALIEGETAHLRSDGALRILRELPRWGWTAAFRLVPRRLRDAVYDVVARNRYAWFGRLDTCMMPQDNIVLPKR